MSLSVNKMQHWFHPGGCGKLLSSLLLLNALSASAVDWEKISGADSPNPIWRLQADTTKPDSAKSAELSLGLVPPFHRQGFDRIELDLKVEELKQTQFGINLYNTVGDRLVTKLKFNPGERGWQHLVIKRNDFTIVKRMGDGNLDWNEVGDPDIRFTYASNTDKKFSILIANPRLFNHQGTVVLNLLIPGTTVGFTTDVGGKPLWQGPMPPIPRNGQDTLCLGAGAYWLLSDNGIKLAQDIRRRFPRAELLFSGVSSYGSLPLRTPTYVRRLWEHQVHFELQKAGLYLPLLEANNCLPVNWQGKTQPVVRQNNVLATSQVAQDDLKAQIDNAALLGVNIFKSVDYAWPYQWGRWGYDKPTVNTFRRDLAGLDEGIEILVAPQQTRTIHFWDYFERYRGLRLKPSDIGINDWKEYFPETEQHAVAGGLPQKRNLAIFNALCAYEWLKQGQRFGRWAQNHGGQHNITANPEDIGDSADHLYLPRIASFGTLYFEYFGSPVCSEGAYYHVPTYRRAADQVGREIGVISELGQGGHGLHYKDQTMEFIHIYDLISAGFSKYHNEWLGECSYDTMVNPANVYHYSRYMSWLNGAHAYLLARRDHTARRPVSVFSVSLRSVVHYQTSWLWNKGNHDSFLTALADRHVDLEDVEPQELADLGKQADVIFYTPRYTPANTLPKLQQWMEKNGHTLITHSYVPGSIDQGAVFELNDRIKAVNYIGEGKGKTYEENYGAAPGRTETETPIHASFSSLTVDRTPVSGRVTGEPGPFADAVKDLLPQSIPATWRWNTVGLKLLLKIGDKPLLSEKILASGGRIIYLHAKLSSLSPELTNAITNALVKYLELRRNAIRDQNNPALVHSYNFDLGRVSVLYDRHALEKFGFAAGYAPYLKNQPFPFAQPGADAACRLLVDKPGLYEVLYLMSGRTETVNTAADNSIPLQLQGTLGDVIYTAPVSPAWSKRIGELLAERNKLVGETIARSTDELKNTIFNSQDTTSGAQWRWDKDIATVHVPWKDRSGTVFCHYYFRLPDVAAPRLSFQAKLLNPASHGAGISITVGTNNPPSVLSRTVIGADGKTAEISADLTAYRGQMIRLTLTVDANGNPADDTIQLSEMKITDGTKTVIAGTSFFRGSGITGFRGTTK